MRKCSNCKDTIISGHVLDLFDRILYYCDENCLRKDNPQLKYKTMNELFDEDAQYYTTWENEEE